MVAVWGEVRKSFNLQFCGIKGSPWKAESLQHIWCSTSGMIGMNPSLLVGLVEANFFAEGSSPPFIIRLSHLECIFASFFVVVELS